MLFIVAYYFYPPASEASREVANLTDGKNPHSPVYGVKEFVSLRLAAVLRGGEAHKSLIQIEDL